MGRAFRVPNAISPVTQAQLDFVPRSEDMNGGGDQGGRLIMLPFGEDVLFNNLSITDTSAHQSTFTILNPTGTPFDPVYAVYKTVYVVSTLNEAVTVQPTFTRDYADATPTWYPYGTTTSVPAYSGTGAAQVAVIALSTPSLYIPFAGISVSCATAPTSGSISAWLERLG